MVRDLADLTDFKQKFGLTIDLPAGQPVVDIPVTIDSDLIPELDEIFSVTLTAVDVKNGEVEQSNKPTLGDVCFFNNNGVLQPDACSRKITQHMRFYLSTASYLLQIYVR